MRSNMCVCLEVYSFEYSGTTKLRHEHFFCFRKFSMDSSKCVSTTSFYGKRYKHLNLALEDVAEINQHVDIVIVPPNPNYQSDDDEIDEDNLQVDILPQDVPGEVEIFQNDPQFDSDDELPLRVLYPMIGGEKTDKRRKRNEDEPVWTKEQIDLFMNPANEYLQRQNAMKEQLKNLSPVEVFEKIFDEEIVKFIVQESNRYASQNNNHGFTVTENEIKVFIAILLISGYHHLPRERLYWSNDEDLRVPIVSNSMSRNRYHEIKKYLHLANNDEMDITDKMWKLRPFMMRLNKNFLTWGIFHESLSIDEAMVKYFGHHSSKQFIRGKPVRFGYKDWMLCSSTGYCYQLDTYCGAKQRQEKENLPLGSKIVLELLKVVDEPANHILFFDNYFTSHSLLRSLREMGFRATGTIRDNRTKKCPLLLPAECKKKERGYFDYVYDEKNLLLFVRWKDNSIVTIGTNYDNTTPLSKVKRWSKEKKEKINVPQPRLFAAYNQGMGGVDLLDQAVNNYRVTIQGKKWWWPLWTHMLNVAVVNAWRLYSMANADENIDLLLFVRNITRHYLRNFEKQTLQSKPAIVPRSLIASESGHFPKKLPKQLRCRQCHQRARWQCIKCVATLCLERDCFIKFHS